MGELKRCPFCNGEAEFILEGCLVGRVRCKQCRTSQTVLKLKGEAVDIWNTRTPQNDEVRE